MLFGITFLGHTVRIHYPRIADQRTVG